MLRKYVLPALSFLGALLGIFIVFWSQKTVPIAPILLPPPSSPYPYAIAGAGIIEASSDNISIGCPFNEIVEKINVVEGNYVQKGDILFQLDLRNFTAQLDVAKASLQAAQTDLKDKAAQFAFYERLNDKHAVSEQIYEQYHYALLQAQEAVRVAESNVAAAEINIQRSIIRAPIAGRILQVNIHVGEIAPISPLVNNATSWGNITPLVLMGTIDPLRVRIDIDEEDAWRYEQGAQATAFIRGNSRISFPLTFELIEPYIIPKSSFTGETAERVDTRVLQVLYTFSKKDLPVYAGQVLDVFIESKSLSNQ